MNVIDHFTWHKPLSSFSGEFFRNLQALGWIPTVRYFYLHISNRIFTTVRLISLLSRRNNMHFPMGVSYMSERQTFWIWGSGQCVVMNWQWSRGWQLWSHQAHRWPCFSRPQHWEQSLSPALQLYTSTICKQTHTDKIAMSYESPHINMLILSWH